MLITSHLVTGATLGAKLSNPIFIFLSAIASHFLLDAIPHWNVQISNKIRLKEIITVLFDLCFGFVLIWFLVSRFYSQPFSWSLVWLGAISAALPDAFHIFYLFPTKGWLRRYLNFHKKIQTEISFGLGMAIQIIFCAIIIYFNLKLCQIFGKC